MTNRRKFIAGLGALATGSAAAMGTGAFTNVEASRRVTVNTAGDANAYMGLTGDDEYVTDDSSSGELNINLGGPANLGGGSTGSSNPGTQGDGFNNSAVTTVESVVTVTNQGTDDSIRVDFSDEDSGYNRETTVYLNDAQVTFTLPSGNDRLLDAGESCTIDAKVDTTGDAGNGNSGSLTIYGYKDE